MSALARRDIRRLNDFLEGHSPTLAARAIGAIRKAVDSLDALADRGFRGSLVNSRHLFVPFGRSGYVIQYVVEPGVVTVLRIFHGLEDR